MSFWGIALKPGQRQKVDVPQANVLHLSQVCLHEPKAGKTYLQVLIDGTSYTFCCLEKDKIEHNSLDLFFGPEGPTFINKGSNEVHMSGYFEPVDDDGEGSEEEPSQAAVKASPKAVAAKASPKVEAKKASPKVEAKKTSPKVEAKAASPKVEAKKASPKVEPKKAAAAAKEEESDDEEGEEEGDLEEGEESEELEPSEEEQAPAAKKKAALAELAKRKAAEQTSAPTKKAKTEAGGKPASASPKAAASSPKAAAASSKADSAKDIEYVKELIAFLKANGKQKMSDLGSKVKRPPGVPKMRIVLDANKDKFAVSGDTVELKK